MAKIVVVKIRLLCGFRRVCKKCKQNIRGRYFKIPCSCYLGGGVLIYSGGDAANLAVAYQGSESQAAENDQKSGYNNQNLGMGVEEEPSEEFAEEERKK